MSANVNVVKMGALTRSYPRPRPSPHLDFPASEERIGE